MLDDNYGVLGMLEGKFQIVEVDSAKQTSDEFNLNRVTVESIATIVLHRSSLGDIGDAQWKGMRESVLIGGNYIASKLDYFVVTENDSVKIFNPHFLQKLEECYESFLGVSNASSIELTILHHVSGYLV